MRRFFPSFGSLYNNSPQGVFQDILEDQLERYEFPFPLGVAAAGGALGAGLFGSGIGIGSALGGGAFFNNYIE